jgi:uncharacterized protein YjbI with pentapeptide repeats
LAGAYVENTAFNGAKLRRANLRGAILKGAKLEGALTDGETICPDEERGPCRW